MSSDNPLRTIVRVLHLPDYHLEDATIEPHSISHVESHRTRVIQPAVKVKMQCGDTLICAGTPTTFVGMTLETLSKQSVLQASNPAD